MLLGIASVRRHAPAIVAQRLRKGSTSSARGAASFVAQSLATNSKLHTESKVLVQADSAYYSRSVVAAALALDAEISVTVRMNPSIRKAIAAIEDTAWEKIRYPQAIFDEDSQRWISKAKIAEVDYTAFASKKKISGITGRLIARRIPELSPAKAAGQDTIFDTHRHHAVFITLPKEHLDTVQADKTRQHANIEAVNA